MDELSKLSSVKEVMTLGCVLAIKIDDGGRGKITLVDTFLMRCPHLCPIQGYRSTAAQKILDPLRTTDSSSNGPSFGVHFRTLGDIGYFITSLNTERKVIAGVEDRILQVLSGSGGT